MDKKNIQDLYPLSPMQQGMLFHSLYAPQSGMYVEQVSFTLRGDLDIQAFQRTWEKMLERHTILRTAFVWENLKEPAQVVWRQASLPMVQLDWSELAEEEQEARLARYLDADQARGFKLEEAPLMRLALMRLESGRHYFVWTHHHILLDGWSIPLLLQDVFALYDGFTRGVDVKLEPVRPYRDYILWLRQQNLEGSKAFWQEKLAGFTTATPFGVDRPVPDFAEGDPEFREIENHLDADTTAQILAFSRRKQLTLNTLIQGAWALLLSRYSREEDVVFGNTVSGRPVTLRDAERMLGLFINTLPVRVQVPRTEEALSWLKRLQAELADLRQYEFSPLMQIQGWSDIERGQPLFNSLLVVENFPTTVRESGGEARLSIESNQSASYTNFPLTVAAMAEGDLSIKFVYDRRRFSREVIQRMGGHMATLLRGLVENPEQRLGRIPMLTEGEKEQILGVWTRTGEIFSQAGGVHHLFEQQVARSPQALAVDFEGEKTTYTGLNRKANQLAAYLVKKGVRRETLIAIYLDRSTEMIVAVLAALKAGGAYVPLDPNYPAERLGYILADTQAQVLLTTRDLSLRLPQVGAVRECICLDQDWDAIAQESPENPGIETGPHDLAYVIYTSGSTGQPKGTLVEHGGVCNLSQAYTRDFHLGVGSVILQFFSFGFDGSVLDFFVALTSGAALAVPSRETILSIPDLHQFFQEHRVTHATMTPTVLGVMAETNLPALRVILSGGEACAWEIANRWAREHAFGNAYGPTEATVASSWFHYEGQRETIFVPIGRPIANTQYYILDSDLQPAPVGVPGELYIAGTGLARGYLNRPELTEERFIPNPFGAPDHRSADRLYRTGDLARWLSDGNVEFLGRTDHQVKIRGFRVELGEIEARLRQHPDIRDAIVTAVENPPGQTRLAAYLVPDGPQPDPGELRAFLEARLPNYMTPSAFVFLKQLPLTPSGKIDRKRLPAPEGLQVFRKGEFVAPSSPEETALAGVFQSVLRVDQVGIHDSFFDLGGDSILALQLVSRARQAGIQITPRQLFDAPTIAGLLSKRAEMEPAVEPDTISGEVPLTPIQQWFFEHHPGRPQLFNTSMLLEIHQQLDVQALEAAVAEVQRHHDALRSRFTWTEAGWVQTIAGPETPAPFSYYDFSGVARLKRKETVETTAAGLQSSLDLTAGPLFRVAYLDFGAGRPGRLMITFHHLVVDGVSWRFFIEDFQSAYLQLSQRQPATLPEKTTSVKRWAEQLTLYARSEAVLGEKDAWLKILEARLPPLPSDHPQGRNTYGSAREITLSLGRKETEALLKTAPAALGVQTLDLLLAAWMRMYAGWTGSRKALIEMEGHGRETTVPHVDVSRTIGWFTTIFPVLFDLEGVPDAGVVQAVHAQLQRAPERGFHFGLLRYLSRQPELMEQLRQIPAPAVNFNYLGQFDQAAVDGGLPFRLAGESTGAEQDPDENRAACLYVVGIVNGGELHVRWLYSQEMYERKTILKLAQKYMGELRKIAQPYL